jgi:hypothetical protein
LQTPVFRSIDACPIGADRVNRAEAFAAQVPTSRNLAGSVGCRLKTLEPRTVETRARYAPPRRGVASCARTAVASREPRAWTGGPAPPGLPASHARASAPAGLNPGRKACPGERLAAPAIGGRLCEAPRPPHCPGQGHAGARRPQTKGRAP